MVGNQWQHPVNQRDVESKEGPRKREHREDPRQARRQAPVHLIKRMPTKKQQK